MVGSKKKRYCVAYAIDRNTRVLVDFNVGKRNKGTLRTVVNSLLLSNSKQIRTDKLNHYLGSIIIEVHFLEACTSFKYQIG